MPRPTDTGSTPTALRAVALGVLVCVAAFIAVNLRRAGHEQGDDFALYLRQARSLLDGDVSAVVSDNRFSVLNSDSAFSPFAYPWGWPLLLTPFVHLWGFDYDRLKLVEVAAFCIWLLLLHGIVRRRLGSMVVFAFVAVFATAPAYLEHTDQLLTEFPHLAAVAAVLWWYDRIRSRDSLLTASVRDLAVLGALVTLAFNIRRESIVLLAVIGVMQLVDLWRVAPRHRPTDLARSVRQWRHALLTPFGTFAVAAIVFQLVLPTDVLPDNGNSRGFLGDRWGEYPGILTDQLGLGIHPAVGIAILLVAALGALIGVRRRPDLDTPLLVLGLFTATVIGSHFRTIERYWFQVNPWVLYFVSVALVAGVQVLVLRRESEASPVLRSRQIAVSIAAVPLAALAVAHLTVLPGKMSDIDEFNSAGGIQDGPAHPSVVQVLDSVVDITPPDAVIAYYRSRTMTLLTDRRAIQTVDINRIGGYADYWVQRRDWAFWQPDLDEVAVQEIGFTKVWSNERFIMWSTNR